MNNLWNQRCNAHKMNDSIIFYFKIFLMMECFAEKSCIQENLNVFKQKKRAENEWKKGKGSKEWNIFSSKKSNI